MSEKDEREKIWQLLNTHYRISSPEDEKSMRRLIASHSPAALKHVLRERLLKETKYYWPRIGRTAQKPPAATAWTTWLILGGRGAGKTRAGSEWVRSRIEEGSARRIALVGESHENLREVMVEGVSGLLSLGMPGRRPLWLPSRHRLIWPNGAVAHCFSAEDPDSLRGFQFDTAWSDELAAWRQGEATWSNLQLGLRLTGGGGEAPRQVITTTPRPIPLLKRIMEQDITVMTHMTTWENEANLAAAFMSEIVAQYEGTRLGRQELMGEVIEEVEGAIWRRTWIEDARVRSVPPLDRVVIAVDPPASAGPKADECGIVVAGVTGTGTHRRGYVLADLSAGGLSPSDWASRVAAAYRQYKASRVVIESNQGGEMALQVLRQAAPGLPVSPVFATRAKRARAEPVAVLYEQGRVHHCGAFPELEDQLLSYTGEKNVPGGSPDRLDALVWVLTELMTKQTGPGPRVRFMNEGKNIS